LTTDHTPHEIPGAPDIESLSGIAPAAAAALKQTARLLRPIVVLLLEHGVTYPQLAETLKAVFIDVAQRSAGRTTDSKLAVTTGIHRKDVKRLRAATTQPVSASHEDRPHSLASAVVTRWLTDSNFCDKVGQPKSLPRHGETPHSFEALVKSISKDVHPRTVLNELNRLELIGIEGDSVRLMANAFVPNADVAQMFDYMGANLHDHAAAAVQNVLGTGPAFLEQSIYSEAIDADAVQELADLARQEWTRILKTVVPEVARHEPEKPGANAKAGKAPQQHARIRLGMYFYAEDENLPAQVPPKPSSRQETT
jgi:hypothetical protein